MEEFNARAHHRRQLEDEQDPRRGRCSWSRDLIPLVKDAKCDVVVCTPAVCFAAVKPIIEGTNIKLGAQNVHFKASGAYTGELSADMLKAAGCEYVIIGHSERRQYFGETDKTVNLRATAAVKAGLKAIICVGEMKDERVDGYTDIIVTYQTQMALQGPAPRRSWTTWSSLTSPCGPSAPA